MTAAMSPIRIVLADARQRLGWTQSELARRSEVPQQTISNIESGRTKGVDFTILERLSNALGIENPLHLLEYLPEKGKRGRG
jgi:transcriptional regulator with XRE-family HTH domain